MLKTVPKTAIKNQLGHPKTPTRLLLGSIIVTLMSLRTSEEQAKARSRGLWMPELVLHSIRLLAKQFLRTVLDIEVDQSAHN